jgi:hypothetical protein
MSDQQLPKPATLSDPASVRQADGQQQPGTPAQGSLIDVKPINPMQSAPGNPATPISVPPTQAPDDNPQRLPYWLQQAERFLRVVVRMYLGLLVCCAPWYPAAWDANPLFSSSPSLMAFITHGAVRGVVSGLGILNLWIALRDALRNPSRDPQ